MVTAELAAALPVLMLLVLVALAAVSVAGARVRAADAAREAARAAARGDPAAGERLARQVGPAGATVSVGVAADQVAATVRVTVHPLAGWLPGFTISERAVAAREPDVVSGVPP